MSKKYLLMLCAAALVLAGACDKKPTDNDDDMPDVPVTEIDLSAYVAFAGDSNAQTIPYMSDAVYANGKVYVACQRLDGWNPGDTSLVVVIDAVGDSVLSTIRLEFRNPKMMRLFNDKLYVVSQGAWAVQDGGVEVINTLTDVNEGTVLNETQIGGDVADAVIISSTKGYVITSNYDLSYVAHNYLLPFNPSNGAVGDTVAPGQLGTVQTMAVSPVSGHMLVLDRNASTPGVYVVDPANDSITAGPIATGLAPNAIAFVSNGTSEDAYILTTDFTNGYLCKLPGGTETAQNNLQLLHADAGITTFGGDIYVLEKMGSDRLVRIDPAAPAAIDGEYAAGASSNLYAVAFVSATKAYVTRNNAVKIKIIDPSTDIN